MSRLGVAHCGVGVWPQGFAEDWNVADKPGPRVFPAVAQFTRVCAYDRPGTPVGEKPSRSDPVPQPTTAANAVADLHSLLNAARETAPYVLVAHSYGGLIARLYASTYPDEVSGLVLVDALSEGLQDAETPEQGRSSAGSSKATFGRMWPSTPTLRGSTSIAALTRCAPPRHCTNFL